MSKRGLCYTGPGRVWKRRKVASPQENITTRRGYVTEGRQRKMVVTTRLLLLLL